MEIKVTKTVTKEVEEVVSWYTQCDRCGETVTTDDMYDAFEFDLLINKGVIYPNGANYNKTTLDLCKSCTEDFKKLLTDNGYKLQVKEIDY